MKSQPIIKVYSDTYIYKELKTFLNIKYKLDIKILEAKSFEVQLGFLMDFFYTMGYEIVSSYRGYKINTHNPTNKLFLPVDEDGRTLMLVANDSTTVHNYYLASHKLLREFNNINEIF